MENIFFVNQKINHLQICLIPYGAVSVFTLTKPRPLATIALSPKENSDGDT